MLSLVAIAVQFGRDTGLRKLPLAVIALSALAIPSPSPAQTTTPDQSSSAAPLPDEPPEAAEPRAPSPEPDFDRPVSWKLLFHNVIADQKQIWSFPARLAHGQNLAPTAGVLGATAGLFFLDPAEAKYFRRTTTFDGFRYVFNGNATAIGMGAVSASLYAIGRLRKDSKMQHGVARRRSDGRCAIVQTVLKDTTMRSGRSATASAGLRPAAHRLYIGKWKLSF